ncbi:hypothetical protein ACQPZF_25185 [Actinosynnema sp. CS-041913]|uniref:hypothetical protein n=1 Tax=Actinosynnema sp. CS-041913 TaxID=3239917 RepID=UPI003D8A66B4
MTVVERVAHAQARAQRETWDRLAGWFTGERCAALDGLLVVDPEVKATRLRWLSTGPVEASPTAVRAEVAKLAFLRGLGAGRSDLSVDEPVVALRGTGSARRPVSRTPVAWSSRW